VCVNAVLGRNVCRLSDFVTWNEGCERCRISGGILPMGDSKSAVFGAEVVELVRPSRAVISAWLDLSHWIVSKSFFSVPIFFAQVTHFKIFVLFLQENKTSAGFLCPYLLPH